MMQKTRLVTWLFVLTFFLATAQKQITINDFVIDGTFNQEYVQQFNWMNDGQFYTTLNDNLIQKNDIATGAVVETLVDGKALNLEISDYSLNAKENKVLLVTKRENKYRRSFSAEYYLYNIKSGQASQLSTKGAQSYATFSPDGTKIAFVRGNNLFYIRLDNMVEYQLTDDGKENSIINGSTDWVYEEEFELTKAFFWSEDSKKLAFYKFDESEVKDYTMQLWGYKENYPYNYVFKYPKAGEDNSKVGIHVYDLESHVLKKMDIGTDKDIYIPSIKWTKDNNTLAIQKMNRLQNTLEILHASARSGNTEQILKERVKTYIDFNYCNDLTYLDGGTYFIYSSEREGYKHFYLHKAIDGQLVSKITAGSWEATELVGIDNSIKTPILYYMSSEDSPLERHLYSVDIFGKKKTKLTTSKGVHSVDMSKDCKYYVASHSSKDTPNQVRLFSTKGNKELKLLKDNNELLAKYEDYGLATKELFSFKTKDLVKLYGYMIKPMNFDSLKKYPVLIHQYSGPGAQLVKDSWSGGHFYWHQLLAQKGVIVVVIDTRGMNGRGESFKKSTYKQLGKLEIQDHLTAANYLGALPFIDKERIGIWGWSYGGYASALSMMLGEGIFKMGIAVAPVTNWRFYDTIYTERYLQRPKDNPKGYDDYSPVTHADKLSGKFLLIHGTGDDNVHVQNSFALQEALVANGKQFQSFYYTDKTHSLGGYTARSHLYTMMTDFVLNNL